MNKFTEIYIKSLINESNENDLQNSTELLDEDQKLVTESFGNWVKNFWKFGSKKEKMLLKLIAEFSKTYRFGTINDDPDLLAKNQGQYNIFLDIDQQNLKKACITVFVASAKNNEQVLPEEIINVKYSWTLDELADAISDKLLRARITLTKSGSPLTEIQETEESDGEEKTSNSIDGVGGYNVGEIKDKLNSKSGDKETKISTLKAFVSGWKKLSEDEQDFFEKLK